MIDGDDDVRLHYRDDYNDDMSNRVELIAGHVVDMPGDGITHDALQRTPLPKSTVSNGVLKVSRHERYVDDLTGQPLCPELCWKVRATELDCFRDREVWTI